MTYASHARYPRLRNYSKRDRIHKQWLSLSQERDNAITNTDNTIKDYDECEQAINAIYAEYNPKIDALWILEFAYEYPEPRSKWFTDVFCTSFVDGTTTISQKQADIFSQYCEEDQETWRSGNTYCRVGNRLVTLTLKNACRCVKFTPLTDFSK